MSEPALLAFNKAAALLKKTQDIQIKETVRTAGMEAFLVEMSEKRAKKLLPKMSGWKTTPQKHYST